MLENVPKLTDEGLGILLQNKSLTILVINNSLIEGQGFFFDFFRI